MERRDTQAAKRALERRRILELRALYPGFPDGELTQPDPPDFLVRTGTGDLAIELTGLFAAGGQSARAREGEWDRVLARARAHYERAGHPPVQVTAHWHGSPAAPRKAEVALSTSLADLVAKPVAAGRTSVRYSRDRAVRLPAGIDRLRVEPVDDLREAFWAFGQGAVVPKWSPELLQAKIDEKDALIESYRDRCDRAWLVLLAEHSYASSWGEHSDASREHEYRTRFERVLVYRTMSQEVTDLRLRHSLGAPDADRRPDV